MCSALCILKFTASIQLLVITVYMVLLHGVVYKYRTFAWRCILSIVIYDIPFGEESFIIISFQILHKNAQENDVYCVEQMYYISIM